MTHTGAPEGAPRDAGPPSPGARLDGLRLAVLDVETTGIDPDRGHRVCQIAVLPVAPDRMPAAPWSTMVNPGRSISPGASRVNGIRDADVSGAPPFSEIVEQLLPFIDSAVIVAHNAPFDLGFLRAEFQHADVPLPPIRALDTLRLARRWYRFRSNRLGAVARQMGVSTGRLHRADADVMATWEIFDRMRRKLTASGLTTLSEFEAAQGGPIHLAAPAGAIHDVRRLVDDAARNGRRLRIVYRSSSGVRRRVIRPERVRGPHVIAWCELRGARRTFRIDRILQVDGSNGE